MVRYSWTARTELEPSPTAAATRFMDPSRTSPTAKTPGADVSNGSGSLSAKMGWSSASAGIVCNADGDCWHTQTDYQYQPSFGLTVHPNDWKWNEGEKHAWREHKGKGYWKGGSWQTF